MPSPRIRPFSQTLFAAIVALIVLVVVGITLVDYSIAEGNLREDQRLLETQTEGELVNAIVLIEAGYALFDGVMNREMEEGLASFGGEYEKVGRNASAMDLARIKHEVYADRMDLYVINASNMVEFTTYPPDQDLDFSGNYDIAGYLDRIRNTTGFYPDRVVHDRFTGQLRKYAYAPTPDHRYILELGVVSDQLSDRQRPIEFGEAIRDIRILNPDVEGARLFTHFKYQVGNASFRPDAELSTRLDRVLESREGFDVVDAETGRKTRYIFIPLLDEAYASDVSKVAEITYTTRRLDDALGNLVLFHALAAVAALGVGLVTAGIVSRRLSVPIRGIADDVDAIARGDLDHPIAPSTVQEFSVLGSSIATMVGRLEETIGQLRQRTASLTESEEKYRQLYAELEERVQERTEDLAAANRELESFTYTVSHDLRSPLRAIDGYTYILLHEHRPDLSASATRYLDQIGRNARQMARLIDDLLNFSRAGRQALTLREVDPTVIVGEVLEDLRRERQGRDVRVAVGDLALCRADPALLKQVFANLIGNAFKFTRTRDVAEIEVGSYADNGRTVYFVRDNGVGFDQKYENALFQVFSRLHNETDYEGTGVGLAIVQRIVERHGGRIWVESRPALGTTFFFTLGGPAGEPSG